MNDIQTGIKYSDYYLPSRFMDIKEYFSSAKNFSLVEGDNDLDSFCETYSKRRMIKGIYIEEENTEVEIFERLLTRFFKTTNIDPREIDILISTKPAPLIQMKTPDVPYYMQKKFNMDQDVATFHLEQRCGASLMGMHVADAMIKTGQYNSALILSSSFMPDLESRNVQVTLFSDGAGVLYLNNKPENLYIKDFLSRTTGSYQSTIESFTQRENYRELMNYLKNGAEALKELLRRNNLDFDSIKLISPQNTQSIAWDIYTSLLDISMDKIFLDNIPKGAHIGDVDTIRNITDILGQGLIQSGEQMIAYGIGWGTSWNGALLEML